MKLPRIVHKIYADLRGYFWMPCPLCHEMFGGHEKHGVLLDSPCQGICTCVNCKEKADAINYERLGIKCC